MMHTLTSYDLWKTGPPDDDSEAWEEYSARYDETAGAILLDSLTESLPSGLPCSDEARQALTRMLDGLDTETRCGWAHEVDPDHIPTFENWARPERAA
jgi:hypothetical protein